MAIYYWFLRSFTEYAYKEAYHITLVSDTYCHLWLRWSFNPPQTHPRAREFRGLAVMGDVYYCFTAYHDIEQDEAGDTLTHTFTVPNWLANQIRWFYFHGEISAVASPSTSPIFGRQLYFTTHDYLTRVSHPNDEVNNHGGSTYSCPTLCPVIFTVGRWQTPAMKEGGAFRFRDFQVPKCAEILETNLHLTCHTFNSYHLVKSHISLEDTSYPDDWAYADTGEVFTRWGTRVQVVAWDDFPPWYVDVVYASPPIPNIIQHLVNRPDWIGGNTASLFWDDFDRRTSWHASFKRWAYCYSTSPAKAPYLTLKYNHWRVKEIV